MVLNEQSSMEQLKSSSTLKPISESPTIADLAYDYIKAAIIAGDLKPGQLYSVSQFASLLGVSRTPVREALLTLVQQGVLRVDRNRGFHLVPISDRELEQVIEVRVMLEIPAMSNLAKRYVDGQVNLDHANHLYPELLAAAEDNDLISFLALDRKFHMSLIEEIGNDRLTSIVGDLRDHTQLCGLRQTATSLRMNEANEDHQQLLRAITLGDADTAAEIMRRHLQRASEEWI